MTNKSNNIIGGVVLAVIGIIILWTVLFNRDSYGFQTVRDASAVSWIFALLFYAGAAYTIYWGLKKKDYAKPCVVNFFNFCACCNRNNNFMAVKYEHDIHNI